MILAYIFGIISLFILLIGFIVFIILLVKKKKKLLSCLLFAGFIFIATIIGVICVIIFAINIDRDNPELTKKYFDEMDKENQQLLDKVNKEEKENDSSIKSEDSSKKDTNTDVDTEDETEEQKTPSLKDQGKIKNNDYNFIITVGREEVKKIREVKIESFEGVTDSYTYCYKTKDGNYEGSSDCQKGEVPIFSINIYTEKQWEEEALSPFAGTVMGQDGGYYFVFYRPNGIFPEDVPSTEEYYNSVIASIDFAD